MNKAPCFLDHFAESPMQLNARKVPALRKADAVAKKTLSEANSRGGRASLQLPYMGRHSLERGVLHGADSAHQRCRLAR